MTLVQFKAIKIVQLTANFPSFFIILLFFFVEILLLYVKLAVLYKNVINLIIFESLKVLFGNILLKKYYVFYNEMWTR